MKSERLLILDACVLIDICLEDVSLLGLAASSLGKVVILSPILEEVHQLNEPEVERLGLCVVDPEMEIILNAAPRRGGLSFRDKICLLFAQSHNGTLYTNDRALLNAANVAGINSRWGLEILIELVAVGQLTSSEALISAQRICDRSRFSSDQLMLEFRRRIREVT